MLFTRQANKISGSVVALNPVQMVNMPSFGQGFAIGLFPNQKVFSDISNLISSGVLWLPNLYIAVLFNLPAFPVISSPIRREKGATLYASLRNQMYWFSTEGTGFSLRVQSSSLCFPKTPSFRPSLGQALKAFICGTSSTSSATARYFLATINTMSLMSCVPFSKIFFLFCIHNYIISYLSSIGNKVILGAIECK